MHPIEIPFISIVVPTYNRSDLLRITLDSLINQDYPTDFYEIIVANNNSSDNTSKVIDEYTQKYKKIKSILEPRQGVHYARNSASHLACGDILYFTDDDMIAHVNMLTELVKIFKLNSDIAVVTGRIVGKFQKPPPNWVRKHLINSLLSLTDISNEIELIITKNDLAFSCHEAIKRDVFFRAGGFNPENTAGVWVGDGETGLGIKIKNLGFKFAYTSRSITEHIIPESRTTLAYLMSRVGNQGFCDAYSEYREHRNKNLIPLRMFKRNFAGIFKFFPILFIKILVGRSSWRFFPAQMVYFYKRTSYDLKLFFNADFRGLVEIDNWL